MKLSVVIPTLNEARYLPLAVRAVRKHAANGAPHEIIVVDCGSVDGTPDIARQFGVKLILDKRLDSRAAALNRGALHSTGDVLFCLDADCIPPPAYDKAIAHALERDRVVAGAFEFALHGRGPLLRAIEVANRLRYRLEKRYYSNQGLFVRADAFRRVRGYPRRRLMESARLCDALKRIGFVVLIRKRMNSSPRRFRAQGILRVFLNDLRICWRERRGRRLDDLGAAYQKDNIRRGLRPDVERQD